MRVYTRDGPRGQGIVARGDGEIDLPPAAVFEFLSRGARAAGTAIHPPIAAAAENLRVSWDERYDNSRVLEEVSELIQVVPCAS